MRTMRSGAALIAVLCLLPWAATAPASAAPDPDRIGLSWDGVTWSSQLSGTLFERPGSIRVWVPGDSETEHFLVRDQGGTPARLAVDYHLPPGVLAEPDNVVLTARIDAGQAVTLAPGTSWLPLGGTALADGQDADVAVTAVFQGSSGNRSQRQRLSIGFRVTLTEVAGPAADVGTSGLPGSPTAAGTPGAPGQGHAAPASDHGPGGSPAGGVLPDTGSPEVRWALGLGLLAVGGGTAIVVLSRRRREHHAQTP